MQEVMDLYTRLGLVVVIVLVLAVVIRLVSAWAMGPDDEDE